MSVKQHSFVNTCSLQIFCLCAIGILFASCIAGDNQDPHSEPLIEKLFSGGNVSADNRVAEHPKSLSTLPKTNESFPVLDASSVVKNASANDLVHNNTSQSSPVKTEPRSSTGKTPSLPFDPNELLKDASPVIDHHQPPVGRKGVNLDPVGSEAKTDVNSDVSSGITKDNTCICTIVASEGSQVEDCQSCSESKSPNSSATTNTSIPSQNGISSTVVPVLNTIGGLNVTNSSSLVNGTATMSDKAVTEPTSVSAGISLAKDSAGAAHETHKPTVLIDNTERLATSPYSQSAFIIPVVAIILTVPLFIAFVMILYKRGKEFWERRHYRRMDFLIDGMYND